MVYGPLYDAAALASPADLNQSTANIYNALLHPALSDDSPVPPTGLHLYVDVRDVARAHLLAAETPAAGGKRFVVCGGQLSLQRIANLLRGSLPALEGRIPRGTPEEAMVPEGSFEASSELARRVLQLDFRSAEDTIGDLATQLVEIENRGVG
jgi:nucleoside-diphosphate-sugar epimerase